MRRNGIKRDFDIKDEHNHGLQYVSPKSAVRGQNLYGRPWEDWTLAIKGQKKKAWHVYKGHIKWLACRHLHCRWGSSQTSWHFTEFLAPPPNHHHANSILCFLVLGRLLGALLCKYSWWWEISCILEFLEENQPAVERKASCYGVLVLRVGWVVAHWQWFPAEHNETPNIFFQNAFEHKFMGRTYFWTLISFHF